MPAPWGLPGSDGGLAITEDSPFACPHTSSLYPTILAHSHLPFKYFSMPSSYFLEYFLLNPQYVSTSAIYCTVSFSSHLQSPDDLKHVTPLQNSWFHLVLYIPNLQDALITINIHYVHTIQILYFASLNSIHTWMVLSSYLGTHYLTIS